MFAADFLQNPVQPLQTLGEFSKVANILFPKFAQPPRHGRQQIHADAFGRRSPLPQNLHKSAGHLALMRKQQPREFIHVL